jgi:MFS family permease
MKTEESARSTGYFSWLNEISSMQKKSLVSASLGWMLDSMDVMLYTMILAYLMKEFGMGTDTAGLLSSLSLVSSALGGIAFGIVADRIGRVKALMGSIMVYSVFTGACGFAGSIVQLAIFRVLLGFGMGGEWATGAALVTETWPSRHRGKGMGLMQSSWAIGYLLAAVVAAVILPRFGWRPVFWVGFLPALLTLWIQRNVEEPSIWKTNAAQKTRNKEKWSVVEIFRPPYLKHTVIIAGVNACTMFAWWGLFTWIPAYLALPVKQGGMGLGIIQSSAGIVVMEIGMWLGFVSFGIICDTIGRKKTFITFLFCASVLVMVCNNVRENTMLLILSPLLAFFGSGYFSGFGTITAEIFPTRVRASAQGFTYNIGRGLSALGPFTIGSLAKTHGLNVSFYVTALFYFLAALLAFFLPETKGKDLVD